MWWLNNPKAFNYYSGVDINVFAPLFFCTFFYYHPDLSLFLCRSGHLNTKRLNGELFGYDI